MFTSADFWAFFVCCLAQTVQFSGPGYRPPPRKMHAIYSCIFGRKRVRNAVRNAFLNTLTMGGVPLERTPSAVLNGFVKLLLKCRFRVNRSLIFTPDSALISLSHLCGSSRGSLRFCKYSCRRKAAIVLRKVAEGYVSIAVNTVPSRSSPYN